MWLLPPGFGGVPGVPARPDRRDASPFTVRVSTWSWVYQRGLEFLRMPHKPRPESDASSRKKDRLVSLARYSEMGFIIPAAILLGFFLGKLADYWLHTKWLFLVGLLFGAVVGFWQMISMALRANKDDK